MMTDKNPNTKKVNSNNKFELPKVKDLEKYCELMEIKQLSLLEIETTTFKIKLKKSLEENTLDNTNLKNKKFITTEKEPLFVKTDEEIKAKVIKSPMVGTVYLAPEPNSKNFIYPGDKVKIGQTLLIVEAMKVMNNITSTQEGIVDKILVNDSQPVEFDQDLILLK